MLNIKSYIISDSCVIQTISTNYLQFANNPMVAKYFQWTV